MTVADRWHKEAETWFTGSVDSVDRRLAQCNTLLHLAREAVAHDGIGPSTRKHLASIVDLEASQGALRHLRHDLLTAASDREAGDWREKEWDEPGPDFGKTYSRSRGPILHEQPPHRHEEYWTPEEMQHLKGKLSSRDRRYVALESAKFLAANPHCPPDELAIRARHHAELQTSTLSAERSQKVTAALVARVTELHRDSPRPRVASRPAPVPACPDELMFM